MDIPCENQIDDPPNRMCGAACLSMIYKYFGTFESQQTIWTRIAEPDQWGGFFSETYKLCADLLHKKLNAIAIKAINPLKVLRICNDFGFPAILL